VECGGGLGEEGKGEGGRGKGRPRGSPVQYWANAFFWEGANAIRPYRGKGQPQGIALTEGKGRPQGSPLQYWALGRM